MLECTYTKDKLKKSKSWKDGYVILRDNKIHLYDDERKKIYCSTYKYISEEIELPAYLIYCEKIGKNSESEEQEVKPVRVINRRPIKNLHPTTYTGKYMIPTKKKFDNVKEKVTEDGIILIDEEYNKIERKNDSPKKSEPVNNVKEKIYKRPKLEILELLK